MKKIMLATALVLSLSAAPAVADEATDALQLTIQRLQAQVDQKDATIKRKVTQLSCERENRRKLVRAVRNDRPMPELLDCRF